ncbi:YhjD/YihY/BrkB family envelope integrity protein [Rhodococcus opacus]|uniref:YhjD/YihY/BrkB family envelope integrity protein n=1 Tax=Rhodococcus opacus TaxID=37919 RepID=UPI001F547743|nr:YhjD/YihY/BrkB family envelope integrity protein [Rhodococcus opacus]
MPRAGSSAARLVGSKGCRDGDLSSGWNTAPFEYRTPPVFAVFPLLLLFSTTLGFVLAGHPDLEQRMINSDLADFPILGTQLRSSTHPLRGNGWALALGVLGALYGAQGIGQAAQNAMNTVWNVPFREWPGFVGRRIRGLTILVLLGIGVLASTTLIGFAPRVGPLSAAWASAAAAGVNFLVFLVCFTVLTSAPCGCATWPSGRWSPLCSGNSCNASGTGSSATPSATPPTCTDSSPSSWACCRSCTWAPG